YQAYAEAIIRVSRRVASTGQPIFIDEQQLAATNGKANWFQSSHVPVLGEDGKVAQVLSVMTDITARKESAEQMLTMVKDLQQALKFKDEFMAVMSHELRTPLNAIVGFSGIALMTGDASAQTTKMLERIDFNARRLVSLINDLLDLSRINAGRVEILWADSDIHELAQAWYENFRERIISKGVTFTLDIDPALPKVISTDPDRLTQVASNLLTNAAKFTETGSVTLSLKMLGADRWMMTVADTGIGISEAYQQAIFEEFRQVEAGMQSKYGGTGLGLAIVQKLCVLMDGQIKVKSKLGEGSTFTATFPLRTAGGQGAA
ncbi:MAG: PAS domain-containing sensor histidine kinase, partial [Anaerolineae bacterium]|nr:PAS domain-containing sensor histidine kinase [Anaerolineae bacterium]